VPGLGQIAGEAQLECAPSIPHPVMNVASWGKFAPRTAFTPWKGTGFGTEFFEGTVFFSPYISIPPLNASSWANGAPSAFSRLGVVSRRTCFWFPPLHYRMPSVRAAANGSTILRP